MRREARTTLRGAFPRPRQGNTGQVIEFRRSSKADRRPLPVLHELPPEPALDAQVAAGDVVARIEGPGFPAAE